MVNFSNKKKSENDVVKEEKAEGKKSIPVEKGMVVMPKEAFLEMRVFHLEMESLQKTLMNTDLAIQNFDYQKNLNIAKRGQVKGEMEMKKREYDEWMTKLKDKHGIDIKNKSINPITLEVS